MPTDYPEKYDESDGGKALVLGTKFQVVRDCTAVAFCYFKVRQQPIAGTTCVAGHSLGHCHRPAFTRSGG